MLFNVFNGEYPFDVLLGVVEAPEDKPEVALAQAISMFGGHPVVELSLPPEGVAKENKQ